MRRLFSSDSWWNTPILPDTAVHEDSERLIGLLGERHGFFHVNTERWTIPVYEADGSTPRKKVVEYLPTVTDSAVLGDYEMDIRHPIGFCPDFDSHVPVPDGSLPDGMADAHYMVVDETASKAWDFWALKPRADAPWTAFTGMMFDPEGSGLFERELGYTFGIQEDCRFGPSRAAGIPAAAGLIMYEELEAGSIDHKLAFACEASSSREFIWPPATWTDGAWVDGVPEGCLIRLDPDLDPGRFGLTRAGKIIARALQVYGAVNVDYSRMPALYAENLAVSRRRGYSWNGILDGSVLAALPISAFKVMRTGRRVYAGSEPQLNLEAWRMFTACYPTSRFKRKPVRTASGNAARDETRRYVRESWDLVEGPESGGDSQALLFMHEVSGRKEFLSGFRYYDAFFTTLGLLSDGRKEAAAKNIRDMAYLILSRAYFTKRSGSGFVPGEPGGQVPPPFLAPLVRLYTEKTADPAVAADSLPSLVIEHEFWSENRSVFGDTDVDGSGCISAESHMDAESGWLFDPGLDTGSPGRSSIALNALLYRVERDIGALLRMTGSAGEKEWNRKAERHASAIRATFRDGETGLYRDYDFQGRRFFPALGASSFVPLWAGLVTATDSAPVLKLLDRLTGACGPVLCVPPGRSLGRKPAREQPVLSPAAIWFITEGLEKCGYEDRARKTALMFLDLVSRAFQRTGTLWDAYDGETGEPAGTVHAVPPVSCRTAGVFAVLYDRWARER